MYLYGPSSKVRAMSPTFLQLYMPAPPYSTFPTFGRATCEVSRPHGFWFCGGGSVKREETRDMARIPRRNQSRS